MAILRVQLQEDIDTCLMDERHTADLINLEFAKSFANLSFLQPNVKSFQISMEMYQPCHAGYVPYRASAILSTYYL